MSSTIYIFWPFLFLHISAQGWSIFGAQTNGPAQEGSLRLVGSDRSSAGRVEVYHDGQWGTVCDDNWGMAQAQVVCRQLGFPKAINVTVGASNGEGTGPIWLDDVICTGAESTLSSCRFKGWAVTDCSHKEDAGVVCESVKSMDSGSKSTLDHSLSLSEDLGSLFDRGHNCDFNILVRDPSDEQTKEQTICAHQAILSLYPQLNITRTSKNLSVEISQTCHSYVYEFIRYLYTRKIEVTLSSAQCLHQLSHIYQVKQLLEDVGKVFILLLPQDPTFNTQVSLYEYGVRTEDLALQENTLQYLSWNFEFLVSAPVWKTLSVHMMEALLSRSDLVVQDEALVLGALEDWLKERTDIAPERKVALLQQIRFPMIPVEKLYDIQFSSDMYKSNEAFYSSAFMKAFQFNTLPFSKIRKHFQDTEIYLPRIYTGEPWSVVINYTAPQYDFRYVHYGSYYTSDRSASFITPVHNSVIFKQQTIQWQAQVLLHSGECSSQGLTCTSFPVARLFPYVNLDSYESTVRFSNKVVLMCKTENIVFHVQDFKSLKAEIPSNSSMSLPNPCPDNNLFIFVVSPEYI
ncbi:galectin-3-binding protein A-like [Hoplias malabaricus]|uniref:galectin-3-binding protein A-like n=1 Tax=Hoplias malabaricus TaxID=27720 RepID=UPI003462170D